jgi:predicted  nucleic acid-binding Zn-ribbon protein
MSQTLNLYRLQQIDSQMDRLRARLLEIQSILDDDTELRKLNEQAKVADERNQYAEKALKQAEREVQNQLIKIDQTQSSLYAGKSHSPKELQDLQNDVAALKRYLVILEDRQIDAMQECETAEADRQIIHDKVISALDNRAELTARLQLEQETIKNDLERHTIEHNAVEGAIPVSNLDLYSQLRQKRRGVAVVIIGENACGACGSTLNLAQIQSVRSSDRIIFCPSCGRILYGN